jgi:hypothetical protein
LPAIGARESIASAMSKIFVNANPQGPAAASPPAEAAPQLAKGFAPVLIVAVMIGAGVLLFYHWRFVLAVLLGLLLFLWRLGRR